MIKFSNKKLSNNDQDGIIMILPCLRTLIIVTRWNLILIITYRRQDGIHTKGYQRKNKRCTSVSMTIYYTWVIKKKLISIVKVLVWLKQNPKFSGNFSWVLHFETPKSIELDVDISSHFTTLLINWLKNLHL